jgi:diaminopimelate epimerase
MFKLGKTNSKEVVIKTKGGELSVKFDTIEERYFDIKLSGGVEMVFSGEIDI